MPIFVLRRNTRHYFAIYPLKSHCLTLLQKSNCQVTVRSSANLLSSKYRWFYCDHRGNLVSWLDRFCLESLVWWELQSVAKVLGWYSRVMEVHVLVCAVREKNSHVMQVYVMKRKKSDAPRHGVCIIIC